jgi:hypothetical protein
MPIVVAACQSGLLEPLPFLVLAAGLAPSKGLASNHRALGFAITGVARSRVRLVEWAQRLEVGPGHELLQWPAQPRFGVHCNS